MKLSQASILKSLHEKTNRPMKIAELAKCLSIPESQRREFRQWIKHMAEEGALIKIRGGRFGLPDVMDIVSGTLQGHPNGFGFLVTDSPEPDLYISRTKMGGAMHLDRVMARVESRGKEKPEGRVIRILERSTKTLTGIYENLDKHGWVIPSEAKYFHDVFVAAKHKKGAKNGQVVTVEILEYPTHHQPPVGRVTEVLGYSDDPQVELNVIMRKHGVRTEFPPTVIDESDHFSETVNVEEHRHRKNLTDQMIFTIDGEKAKDFDDAVSIEMLNDHYRLGVHIADVSHYVEDHTALNQEAFERGTSIYFPEGVVPMLPFNLSNGICSLKPDVERLTVSVLIDFNPQGEVIGYKVFDSIIKSKIRFTYNKVAQLLREKSNSREYDAVMPDLRAMRNLSQTLRKRRFKNGSVNFNVPEPVVIMDAEGKVENIVIAEHNIAHEIIEEFMLAANQVVARYLDSRGAPFIHRIHESPDEDKLAAFNDFIKTFGLKLGRLHNIPSKSLHRLLEKVQGRPEERVVNTLLLRTMKKARYSEIDPGHYCLGFEHYTHFTSPIRRYPDLITHRVLKKFFKRKCSQKERKKMLPQLAEYADQSSERERKAMQVEREINDLRRAQFMVDKIGQAYSGIITSVVSFGFFVELSECFVEGLVKVSNLTDDYYVYLEEEHKWKGMNRQKIYQIGDPVKVRVQHVDIALRQIDFALIKT
ncbi:MAG: ribonuclease R [Nitrospinales bacterium]